MKSLATITIVCMVAIASLVAVQPCEAGGINAAVARRARSREVGRIQAQASAFGARNISGVRVQSFQSFHGPSIRVVPSAPRVLIIR